jgi:ribosomal protein S18 acetylase RimI-like enzyme
MDSRNWEPDVRIFHELYNACFRDVWGFVETSWGESLKKAQGFRRFYHPDLAVLAERDGEGVGFALVLPDLNTVLARQGGSLFPCGWLRTWREIPAIRTGRFILAGVLPGSEGQGLAPAMILYLQERARRAGFTKVEVALVQAANQRMLKIVEAFGCRPTKTFRLYGKNF